jgi:hypothetical protein
LWKVDDKREVEEEGRGKIGNYGIGVDRGDARNATRDTLSSARLPMISEADFTATAVFRAIAQRPAAI